MVNSRKTRAIVLHSFKYGDSSLISHVYTEMSGRRSIIIKGAFGKKSSTPAKWFQPLTLVNGEILFSTKREIQSVRHLELDPPLFGLQGNPVKSAIALFLGEFLYKVLREEDGNNLMFEFLYNSILIFDTAGYGYANFHLLLLLHLLKFMGLYPNNDYNGENCWFDLEKGHFTRLPSARNINSNVCGIFSEMLDCPMSEMDRFNISLEVRNTILDGIISFYTIHHGGTADIKSLEVLRGVRF